MAVHVDLGELVRRRDRSQGRAWGLVVGLVLAEPAEALVRWADGQQSTFEPIEDLVDAVPIAAVGVGQDQTGG